MEPHSAPLGALAAGRAETGGRMDRNKLSDRLGGHYRVSDQRGRGHSWDFLATCRQCEQCWSIWLRLDGTAVPGTIRDLIDHWVWNHSPWWVRLLDPMMPLPTETQGFRFIGELGQWWQRKREGKC